MSANPPRYRLPTHTCTHTLCCSSVWCQEFRATVKWRLSACWTSENHPRRKWVWNCFLRFPLRSFAFTAPSLHLQHLWPAAGPLSPVMTRSRRCATPPQVRWQLIDPRCGLVSVALQAKSLRTRRCLASTRSRWTASKISTSVWRRPWSRARSSPCTRQKTLPGLDKR